MGRFTTTTGVTFSAGAARKTSRGSVKAEILDDLEVDTQRPKKLIFDDIENETTIRSPQITNHIETVMKASMDGLDQIVGSWVVIGNYLSLRGNIARLLTKYKSDDRVKVIMIPIIDEVGKPTWEAKYVRTDAEEALLFEQGIIKSSIETIQRETENFETEFLNNPKRTTWYRENYLE